MTAPLTYTDVPPAEAAVQRLERLEPELSQRASDAPPALSRPLAPWREHVQGPAWAAVSVVVYGAYGAPESQRLGEALTELDAAADRVVFDVESALAGGFRTTPTVFVNGEWFTGSLEGKAIWAAGTALVSP